MKLSSKKNAPKPSRGKGCLSKSPSTHLFVSIGSFWILLDSKDVWFEQNLIYSQLSKGKIWPKQIFVPTFSPSLMTLPLPGMSFPSVFSDFLPPYVLDDLLSFMKPSPTTAFQTDLFLFKFLLYLLACNSPCVDSCYEPCPLSSTI